MGMWDKERDAVLRQGLERGLYYHQIAEKLGCSTAAVSGRVSRLGLQRGPTAVRRKALQQKLERAAARSRMEKVEIAAGQEPRDPDLAHQQAERNMRAEVVVRDPSDLIPHRELQAQHCRYPIGDVRDPSFGYCGAPRVAGLSYCPFHAEKCIMGINLKGRQLSCDRVSSPTEKFVDASA